MKKKTTVRFAAVLAAGLLAGGLLFHDDDPLGLSERVHVPAPRTQSSTDAELAQAFRERISDVQVQGRGVVERVLPDDEDGSRHQRFILRLASGQTLLVAHNIDLAPRLEALDAGDAVEFFGEYEWNAQGGVIHWTHRDPDGEHVAGWLRHEGTVYQ